MKVVSEGRIGTAIWDPPRDLQKHLDAMHPHERKLMIDLYHDLIEQHLAIVQMISYFPTTERAMRFRQLLQILNDFARQVTRTSQ